MGMRYSHKGYPTDVECVDTRYSSWRRCSPDVVGSQSEIDRWQYRSISDQRTAPDLNRYSKTTLASCATTSRRLWLHPLELWQESPGYEPRIEASETCYLRCPHESPRPEDDVGLRRCCYG